MINKEKFISYINKIKELRDIYDAINEAGRKLEMFTIYDTEYESLIVDILQEVFDDKENDWIGYFIYELDFSDKWEKGCVINNGVDMSLRNAGELYDILIGEIK